MLRGTHEHAAGVLHAFKPVMKHPAAYYGANAIRISTVDGVFQIPSLVARAGAWDPGRDRAV
jgi:hypothetical protein